MQRSDITIDKLDCLSEQDAAYVVSLIRSIPGFPAPNILFRDFMPLMADARGLNLMLDALEKSLPVPADEIDYIAGLEARGFLFGPALAARLHKGFIAVRKAGKLPPPVESQSYTLEYGEASIEIEPACLRKDGRVLIVDDLIATGGTAHAAQQLITRCGGHVVGYSFVMELIGLDGRKVLEQVPITTLVSMPA